VKVELEVEVGGEREAERIEGETCLP